MIPKKIGVIYMHRNLKDNKIYIGKTTQKTETRWGRKRNNLNKYKSCNALYNALLKHGWENFESTILETVYEPDSLALREEFYILKYNCLAPLGYNIKILDNGLEKHSIETKLKISQKAKGRKRSTPSWNQKPIVIIEGIEHRHCKRCDSLKSSDCYLKIKKKLTSNERKYDTYCKDCKNTYKRNRFGYKRKDPEEVATLRKKQALENSKRFKRPEYRQKYKAIHSKPVLQINPSTNEVIKEWSSAKEASIDGFKSTGISIARDKNVLYKGFYWKSLK